MSDNQETQLQDLAFPFEGVATAQQSGSGLSKLEYFSLHLMAASVTAHDHSIPQNMTEQIAKAHAQSAIMLARALSEGLNSEKGR